MFNKILIANRGEIACRVIKTARKMGITTVAIHSDADRHALHVQMADEAVHIGPSPAAESYLVGEKIIAAARKTGAEAIHPGYGFLSENADFARAVIDAGLIWVGPKPASIEAMGLKDAAKKLMRAAGVPVTPGYEGEDQSPARLADEANKIGYPVLIKAVAGGGGKGMRKVDSEQDFVAALESCKREASSSFGNDEVLLEKWITSPRHIEVQVFGDAHGNVVHLFERDCSLQRRHQKVIEEAPAPGMDEATREEICVAAVRAAKAVDYEGAGTIEFIADASEGLRADRIFFMEMNTRLQVEHPVTEEITGVDLVEWQLRVASGEPIPLKQEDLSINGWAIEARLYAEDPAKGFLPSTGPLTRLELLGDRIETGVRQGGEVSPFYDPMIAKLVVHRSDRAAAVRSLSLDCSAVTCWPVRTNAEFLWRALEHETFRSGEMTTGFLEDASDALLPSGEPSDEALQALSDHFLDLAEKAVPPELVGLRLNAPKAQPMMKFSIGNATFEHRHQWETPLAGRRVEDLDEGVLVNDLGTTFVATLARSETTSVHAHDGDIIAPMPGKVIALDVAEGDSVTAGQRLMVLEAMKMEHALTAPFDGTVTQLSASEGAQVQVEAVLAVVEHEAAS